MNLKELYYGKKIPVNQAVDCESEYYKLCLKSIKLTDELSKRLSADDVKCLDRIIDLNGRMSDILSAESYMKGFRDCAELIADTLFGSNENLK